MRPGAAWTSNAAALEVFATAQDNVSLISEQAALTSLLSPDWSVNRLEAHGDAGGNAQN